MQLTARMSLLFALAAVALWPSQMILCQERDGSIGFESPAIDCCMAPTETNGSCGSGCEDCRDYESSAWNRAKQADSATGLVGVPTALEFRFESPLAALPMAAPRPISGSANPIAPCLAATILLL